MNDSNAPPGAPRREIATAILLACAGALVGGVFFVRFAAARVVIERLVQPGAAAVLVAAASLGCGHAALRGARWIAGRAREVAPAGADADPAEELLVGVCVYGILISALAWAGLIHPLIIGALTLVAAGWGALTGWRRLRNPGPALRPLEAFLLLIPTAIAFVGASTPVNSPDELVYKLAVPRTWSLFGRMIELPLNSDSYFPSAVYMADLGAMFLGRGIAAKLLHFILYVAVLRIIYRLSARFAPSAAGWLTAVIAWTPALVIISGWAWAEWAMIGLVLLSFDRWERFLDDGDSLDLAVAAAALGAALSTKYTALPWLAIFLVVALLRIRGRKGGAAAMGLAALITTLFGGFFYLRNLVWTGSPLAPFFLPGSPAIANYRSKAGGWEELIRGFDIFHAGIIDDSLGILLPVMVLLSPLVLRRAGRRTQDFFIIGAVQLIGLITLAPTSRLMLLAIVPLALLGAAAVEPLWRRSGTAGRALLAGAAGLALYGQLLLVMVVFTKSWDLMPYLAGIESEAGYISKTRDFYAPYEWASRNTPAEAKFLLLGENRSYYLDRRAIAAGNLDGPRMAAWLGRFPSPDRLASELLREGFTHVLIHKRWYRVGDFGTMPMSMVEKEYLLVVPPSTDAVVKGCLARWGTRVYEDRDYVVFALRH